MSLETDKKINEHTDRELRSLTRGIKKLFISSKGTLSIIILCIATFALFSGHLPGMYFAAVVGTVGSVFSYTQHRTDIASFQNGAIQNGSATSSAVSFTQPSNTPNQPTINIDTSMRGK
jgi:hypothetical protein